MKIEEIQSLLAKPAIAFETGGFRPTNENDESWIGRVFLFGPNEEIPKDKNGNDLLPLAQLYLSSLPFCVPCLQDIELITVFIAEDLPEEFAKMGDGWLIREYRTIKDLVRKDLKSPDSYIKPFPLKPILIEKDYPLWDGGGVPSDIEDEILALEENGEIESYYDIVTHSYLHKIGGYPSFCQSGVDFGNDFEFAFQISSDEKAKLNIVDNGSLMFAKNSNSGQWAIYYDFY